MDERENQQRAIEETRERIGQIAGELAERANPPYVKARVREAAEREAEIVKEAAIKKALIMKEDVKEAAMRKAVNVRGRVLQSPTTYSLLGALGGWLLGAFIGRRVPQRLAARTSADERLWADEGLSMEASMEPSEPGISERASGAVAGAKGRASEAIAGAKEKATETINAAREKLGGTVSNVRERIPSADEVSAKANEVTERTSSFIHDAASTRPLLFALIPLCLGAIFAAVLPISSSERRALARAKQKVNEQLSTLGERVENRIAAQQGSDGQAAQSAQPAPSAEGGPLNPAEVHVH